ncbi:MAG: RNase adapter RapZ [Tibeticola sp.]|nr:RNase adapter RapZ [Tibeticola sp.]
MSAAPSRSLEHSGVPPQGNDPAQPSPDTPAAATPTADSPDASTKPAPPPLNLVLITGLSGSGKSVALHALEDAGYFCVDNLPPELIGPFIALEQRHAASRVAIAIDARSADSLSVVPDELSRLRAQGLNVQPLFLDATTDTLVRRYSETRRRHPLSKPEIADQHRALVEAIELERRLLTDLREIAPVIDTSLMRAAQLRSYVRDLVAAPATLLTLVFESFAFKRGVPVDADYVFDVRMLPNPHYEPELKPLTGKDAAVAEFLAQKESVAAMERDITRFLDAWLEPLSDSHRSYVTVAIGCTGGQHRSVYLVERLALRYRGRWPTLVRHREIDAAAPG